MAGFKKLFEFRSVTVSPRAWIQARHQLGEPGIHAASNRRYPDSPNRSNVVSFARSTLCVVSIRDGRLSFGLNYAETEC